MRFFYCLKLSYRIVKSFFFILFLVIDHPCGRIYHRIKIQQIVHRWQLLKVNLPIELIVQVEQHLNMMKIILILNIIKIRSYHHENPLMIFELNQMKKNIIIITIIIIINHINVIKLSMISVLMVIGKREKSMSNINYLFLFF